MSPLHFYEGNGENLAGKRPRRETEDPTSLFQLRADKRRRAIAAPRDLPALISFSGAIFSIFVVSRLLIPRVPRARVQTHPRGDEKTRNIWRDGCGAGRDQNRPRALRNSSALRNCTAACTRGACHSGTLNTRAHVHRTNICPSTCCARSR